MPGNPKKRARREAARKAAEDAERNRPADLSLKVSPRQAEFIKTHATEVLFGGAAGGGKSYGQLIDALLYALRYPGSKQLIFRRTYPDLEKSLIRVSLGLYPQSIYSYNASTHTGRFKNGSLIDFGYSASENDVYQYQSAEYDVIRFDELTHFTEFQYVYMLSRLRGISPAFSRISPPTVTESLSIESSSRSNSASISSISMSPFTKNSSLPIL